MTEPETLRTHLTHAYHRAQPTASIEEAKIRGEELEQKIQQVWKTRYKPVATRKVPIPVSVPAADTERAEYKPLPKAKVPNLPTHPPSLESFNHTKKLTPERVEMIMNNIPQGFLSDSERDLLLWVVAENEAALAFEDSERGTFKEQYFPPYIMETVPHKPWQEPPIRMPYALETSMGELLREQKKSGNLEESRSSYRSRIFVVQKPSGGLRVVWDLRPLNAVSLLDATLPPDVNEFAEAFVGRSVYGTMDLYSGFHQRTLHKSSRPLTACQTKFGNFQLTSLPMGYSNSMEEFQRSSNHTIANIDPKKARAYVDDIGAMGPESRYNDEPISENPKIRRFIWEYAHTLYEILATFIIAGCTAAGKKLVIATPIVHIVGNLCSLKGRRPHHGIITKILNWPIPANLTGVRGFLGTAGVARRWIKNFASIAKPLTVLTKGTNAEFRWNEEAQQAMETLKQAATRA